LWNTNIYRYAPFGSINTLFNPLLFQWPSDNALALIELMLQLIPFLENIKPLVRLHYIDIKLINSLKDGWITSKTISKMYFELGPKVFDGIQIRWLRRPFHDWDMVFSEEFEDAGWFVAWCIILHKQTDMFICDLNGFRVIGGF